MTCMRTHQITDSAGTRRRKSSVRTNDQIQPDVFVPPLHEFLLDCLEATAYSRMIKHCERRNVEVELGDEKDA